MYIYNAMESLMPGYLNAKKKWQFPRKIELLKMIKEEKLNIQVYI